MVGNFVDLLCGSTREKGMIENGEPAQWTDPYPTKATWYGYRDHCQMVFEGASGEVQPYSRCLVRFPDALE